VTAADESDAAAFENASESSVTVDTHDGRVELSGEEQSRTVYLADHGGKFLLKTDESFEEFTSAFLDIPADRGFHGLQDASGHGEPTGIGRHGVAVRSRDVAGRRRAGQRQDRDGELTPVQRLRESLQIGPGQRLESGIVNDAQTTMSAQA